MYHQRTSHGGPINICLITVLCLILFPFQTPSLASETMPIPGLLDLRETPLTEGEVIAIRGNWQFYWDRFLYPGDRELERPDVIVEHQFWNRHSLRGKPIPAIGCGSYRMVILLNPLDVNHELSMYVRETNTSARFFINSQLVGSIGNPSVEETEAVGSWKPKIINFNSLSDTLELIIHVSNYDFRNGGLGRPLILGHAERLLQDHQKALRWDIFFIGIYLALGIYHFGMMVLRPLDRSSRWLAIVFILWISRLLFSGNYTVLQLVGDIPLAWLMRMEYASLYSLFLSTAMYFSLVNEKYLIPHGVKILKIIGAVYLLSIGLPNTYHISIFGKTFLMMIPLISLLPFVAVIRAAIAGVSEARITVVIGVVLILGLINDILYTMDFIDSQFVVPYAFLIFILSQAFVVARYHTKMHDDTEKQAREKSILLNEVHHRVRNNLGVVISLLHMEARKADLPKAASEALEDSIRRIHSMSLVHSRLYSTGDFAAIEMGPYVESLLSEMSATLDTKNIEFHLHIDDISIDLNRAIPCALILNELLTNVAKHAIVDGKGVVVNVVVKLEKGSFLLAVQDNGPGILDHQKSKEGSLGLNIVSMLTDQLGGELHIKNDPGAHFQIVFPEIGD